MKKPNEEDIQKRLEKLPAMEDRQSKEQLYQRVSARIQPSKKKVAPWLFPGMATIAVLLVLAVFIPVFFTNNGWMSTTEESADSTQEEMAESSASSEESDPSSESSTADDGEESKEIDQAESTTEEEPPSLESGTEKDTDESGAEPAELKEDQGTDLDSYVVAETLDHHTTLSYPGKNAEVVIPTYQRDDETQTFDPATYGLTERLVEELEYEVDENERTAVAIFPDEFNASGTAMVQMIVESIRWDLEGFPLDKITLQTTSGDPVPLGNYGEMTDLPVIQSGEYVYHLYQTEDSSNQLLAPVPLNGSPTFQEALSMMKEKGRGLHLTPAVPEHVQFTSVTSEGGSVQINLQHGAWESEQQLLMMMEAVMASAGQFGFEEVQFNGIDVQTFSTYDLDKPIPVPEKVNPIQK